MKEDLWVAPGDYQARVVLCDEGDWGKRVGAIVIEHVDYRNTNYSWESICNEIGVDSGQCGIFDDAIYPDADSGSKYNYFIETCYSITAENADIIYDSGVVASSGYGDGCYELFAKSDGERYVALLLDFQVLTQEALFNFLPI